MAIYYSEGLFQMEVTEQRLGKTSNGNAQWIVRGKIMNRLHDDGSSEPVQANYDRTIYRVITEKTVPYIMEDLEGLGCPGLSSWKQLDQDSNGCFDLRGKWIEVVCKHGVYNGNEREEWGFNVNRTTTLEFTPLDAQGMRSLDNLFGKALKGMKTNGKPAEAPKAKPAGMVSSPKQRKPAPAPVQAQDDDFAPVSDDDVPF